MSNHHHHGCCEHGHPHGHGHSHVHAVPTSAGRLALVTLLNLAITAAELIGGVIGGSLALVSDAVHNFGDGLAIVLAWFAIRLGARPSDARHTFGWHRAEILAAFINGMFLSGVALYLIYEAILRWLHPEPIRGALVLIVAAVGLVANLVGAALLFRAGKESLNLRAGYLHLLSDTISSVIVVIGGLLFMLGVDSRLDSILTAGLSIYMLYQGVGLLRQCVGILLQAAPDIDLPSIETELRLIPGIRGLHHVHVWQLDDRTIHFEAHVQVDDMPVSQTESLAGDIRELLTHQHRVGHVVLQFETGCCRNAGLIVNCR
jgi:cobalt-zinc-cadmium efflux system protein